MTALKQFDRLEATGLWRSSPEDQRREVIVSLGEASLTLSDINGKALAHWSLGAVNRANGSQVPAIYHPDNAAGETLELPATETEMIEGLDRVLKAIDRRRPRPGKLRFLLSGTVLSALVAGAVFWLPDALERYAVNVVPSVKRTEIGNALLAHIQRVSGMPCMTRDARRPLERFSRRLLAEGRVVIVPGGARASAHLPGNIILINRNIVEDHEDPDVAAGYVLAEQVRADQTDPLAALLDHAGLFPSLRLLTTGALPEHALSAYAEVLMTGRSEPTDAEALIAAFDAAGIRSSPYAYALDITGERTLNLIEADPLKGKDGAPVLDDSDWVRLQGICGV